MKKPKQRRGSLSVIEKYSYGIGCLGSNMIYGIIATFGMIYLTDEVKLPAGAGQERCFLQRNFGMSMTLSWE